MRDLSIVTALALAAVKGGAAGLRINGPEDIEPFRSLVDAPIIGLHKVYAGRRNITPPTLALAAGLAKAGAEVLALDATEEALEAGAGYFDATGARLGLREVSVLAEGEVHAIETLRNGAHILGVGLGDALSLVDVDKIHRGWWRRCDRRALPR